MNDNKVIFFSGSSSGIGWELLQRLVQREFFLILPVRNYGSKPHLKELVNKYSNKIEIIEIDLGDVRSFTNQEVLNKIKQYEKIDILLHNAGIYTHSKKLNNGIELQWLVNYIAPAYLTLQFKEQLSKSDFPQVLFVSSRMHYMAKIDFEDIQYSKSYNGQLAYANSKFAITAFCMYLAEKWKDMHINACHPGVYATGITRDLPFIVKFLWNVFIPEPKEGADVLYKLLFSQEYNQYTGTYFDKLTIAKAHKNCYDKEIQQKLLNFLEEVISFAKA
ncbi:MAG: short-chain dehydrogenase [Leptospiraceae bacterium]|nr:MAG: short-chain dehydrogenase [Leptospiraceae bacterium]